MTTHTDGFEIDSPLLATAHQLLEKVAAFDAPAIDATDATESDEGKITFSALNLDKPILKALEKSGYTHPTPIQAQAIPHALDGRDLLLSAQTGSGKTAAFTLPVLDKLSREGKLGQHVYALILTPTRELATQVHDSVRRYGGNLRGMYSLPVVGGSPYSGQIRALCKGVQVLIATPGRLIDHIREGRVDLSKLDILILDEADRMLDMGFADDIKEILESTPETRQTIMSSATWDGAVGQIAESFTTNPERVAIKVESAHIDESVYYCDDFNHKNRILMEVLNNPEINQAVIFTATKRSTEQLAERLVEVGYKARYLHGDLPQGKRNRIVSDMKSGKCDILIATDVAARGIDISAVSHVINYDLPRQVEDYVHRIGRCGRAGRSGTAVSLCSFDERNQMRNINRYLKREMTESTFEGMEPKRTPRNDKPWDKKGAKRGGSRFGGERRSFGERDANRDSRGERRSFGGERRERDFNRDDSRGEREFNRDNRSERFARGDRFENRGERRFDSERPARSFERRERDVDSRPQRSFSRDDSRSDNRSERRFDGERRERRSFDERPRTERNFSGERRERSFDDRPRRFDDSRSERPARSFERRERSFDSRERSFDDRPRRFEERSERRSFGERDGNRGEGRSFGERRERSFDSRSERPARSDKFGKPAGFGAPKKRRQPNEEVFFAKRQAKKAKKFGSDNA